MEISIFDKVAAPSLFADFSTVEMDFVDEKVKFCSNDLDSYLFARGRLTDAQLAALTSQVSSMSSAFDGLSDDDKVKFLSSRYSQNFASVDSYRQYIVANLDKLESEINDEVASSVSASGLDSDVEPSSE